MPRRVAPLFFSLLSIIGGCFDTGRPSEASLPVCKGGKAEPLAVSAVSRVLRRHKFSVAPESDSAICGGDVVADLTNIHFSGPNENIESHDEIGEREGHVGCTVRRKPLGNLNDMKLRADLDAPPASPIFSGRVADFYLANVECTIYPEGAAAKTQVKRLNGAMEELERLLRRH